ncbi:hypothetical protein ABBQ32_011125 [Trebouxia sp. C0010 RCD-2024]
MSLSRAWLSGCQPIARACLLSHTLRRTQGTCLADSSCIQHQRLFSQFSKGHRLTTTHSNVSSRTLASASSSLEEQVKEKNKKHPVVVYSKSWCPYCGEVKRLFSALKVDFTAIELDEVVEGDEVQDALLAITQSRTVPQVFIRGEFIGGCDDTLGAYSTGELAEKLSAAGIDANF